MMSTEPKTNTTETPTRCTCGAPATEESAKYAAFLPKCWVPLCARCEAAQEAEDVKNRAAIEERRRIAEREARLAVIPPEMLETSPAFPRFNAGLLVRVESWRPSSGKWLGIVGGAGLCKTRCLAVLCRRLILEGHRVTWTTATEFQDRVDDLRGDAPATRFAAQAYLREVKSAAILVFDDLGKNLWTPAFERHLFGLIDYRKTHFLPVLWTANSSPLEILQSGQLTKDRGAPLIGRFLEASTIEKA